MKIACQSEIKGTLFLKASCDLIFYLQKKSDFLFQNKKIFCLIWKSLLINQNNVQNKFENSLILVKMFLQKFAKQTFRQVDFKKEICEFLTKF